MRIATYDVVRGYTVSPLLVTFYHGSRWKELKSSLMETVKLSAMIFAVIRRY